MKRSYKTKKRKITKKYKFNLISMAPDPFNGDPLEKHRWSTTSVREANTFLRNGDGKVEWNGKIVGYNWGELQLVRTEKGKPKIVD